MQLLLGVPTEYTPLRIGPAQSLTPDEFFALCASNPGLSMELSSDGEITIMPPAGAESSLYNFDLAGQFHTWVRRDNRGKGFDSSAGFSLPDGSVLSPDLAWIRKERIAGISRAKLKKFPPLCPDFVVEIMSPSDRLSEAQEKMRCWIENGAQLGWLTDPDHRAVHVYRPGMRTRKIVGASEIYGDDPIKGFTLDLTEVWDV